MNPRKAVIHKVCHVLRLFSPDHWGGIESAVFNLSVEQQRAGIDSEIVCTSEFSKPGSTTFKGIPIHRFSCIYPWLGLSEEKKQQMALKGGNPLSLSLFRYLMKLPELSILHTHIMNRLGGTVRTAARLRGIPYVVTIHSGFFRIPLEQTERMRSVFKDNWEWGKVFSWLLGSHRVLKDANAIICVGKDEYEVVQRKFPEKPTFYIPNGIDVSFFANRVKEDFRKELGIPESDPFVLCVSRIDYQKNQLLLVKSFAKFHKEHPQYRLVLIGSVSVAEYLDEIKQTARDLQIEDRVHIIPGYPPHDSRLASAYQAADMFVLPSLTEPFGIVILEAWAAKAPVIASKVGGIPDFVTHDHNGLLFDSGDEQGLYEQMKHLAQSEHLRKKIMAQGWDDVQLYSWPLIHRRILEVYSQLYRT